MGSLVCWVILKQSLVFKQILKISKLLITVLYSSDSQPGVRVPLGVRKHTAGGTWKHLIITCVTLYFLRIINMGVLMVWQIGSGGTQDKKGWETLLYSTVVKCFRAAICAWWFDFQRPLRNSEKNYELWTGRRNQEPIHLPVITESVAQAEVSAWPFCGRKPYFSPLKPLSSPFQHNNPLNLILKRPRYQYVKSFRHDTL